MEKDIRFTVGLILGDERERFLILRRNPKRYKGWGLIKGGVKECERPDEACLRETLEEIGIKIEKEKLHDLSYRSAYYDNSHNRIVLVQWFVTRIESILDLILEDEEWVEYRWATYDEALYELAWQNQQRALKIASLWLQGIKRQLEDLDEEL